MGIPKFILPDLVRMSYGVFGELERARIEHPEIFKEFSIAGVHGAVNELYWHEKSRLSGDVFIHGNYFSVERSVFSDRGYSVFLDMSNPLLDEHDCLDRYGNKVLKSFHDSRNTVILASDALQDYVKENYPEYSICWKFFSGYSIVDVVEKLEEVDYVLLPTSSARNDDFVNGIPRYLRSRCVFCVNDMCSAECQNFTAHLEKSARIAIEMEDEEYPGFCPVFFGRMDADGKTTHGERLDIDMIADGLCQLGYETFYIDNSPVNQYHFLQETIKMLVKEKHQLETYRKWFNAFQAFYWTITI